MILGDMPLEIIREIHKGLKPTDLVNSALSNIDVMRVIVDMIPKIRAIKIGITSEKLNGKCDGDEFELHIPKVNREEIQELLHFLMPQIVNEIHSLQLENELVGDEISDEQLAQLLQLTKNAPLKQLALSEIDLERINTWTLALLAGYDKLEKVEIEGCNLGGDTEAKLLRCFQASFQTLTQIDLKGTSQITDHFSQRVSRSCPNLAYFRISDCPRVTTLSALPFIESTAFRLSDKLDVHMDNTEFDANQLQNFMRSPLFGSQSAEWSLKPVVVPLGYDKPAVLALHSSRKCVLIFV